MARYRRTNSILYVSISWIERRLMKITTTTGSVYHIEDGLCNKFSKDGERVDTFKVWTMKPVPNDVVVMSQLYDLPTGEPEIGKRLYLSSRSGWWLSTQVVSIEE
jgi:hypothetical protein